MLHPDQKVQTAIVHLCDALCTWERATGRQNVLIVREVDDYCFRAMNGKPGITAGDITDAELVEEVINE